MATYTLLELVQRVLGSIKGEEVNNISDTAESLLVRDIVKEVYFDIIADADIPEHGTLFELNASGDSTKPVLMTIPSDIVGMEWLKYNIIGDGETKPNFTLMTYMPLPDFMNMIQQFNVDEDNVLTMTLSGSNGDTLDFYYKDDQAPQYYTTHNDDQIIFDAFDDDVDSTLVKAKTMAWGYREPTWTNSNSFVPDLDSQQFNLLLQEAKALAWYELKKIPHEKAERKARRAQIMLQKKGDKVNYNQKEYYYTQFPDYGRKS